MPSYLDLRTALQALALLLLISPPYVKAADSGLSLDEAQRLALDAQPLLQAQAAAVQAARDNAVAAAQLPDPKLTGGVTDWPVNGPDRYSLRRDDFTMINVGVTQDFPRAEKRRLRGQRGEHEAELAEQMLTATQLTIRRDAALAWLDVWRPERALELTRQSVHEAELQLNATEIAYTSGRATQAEVLAARIALGLLRDDNASLEQETVIARSKLSRWIGGDAAQRLFSAELPQWAPPAPMEEMLIGLRHHPHLNTEAQRVAVAEDEVALARQAYKPDWGVALSYGYRPDFADYISMNFSIDLPVFAGNRQDRNLGAKLAERSQIEQSREDVLRQQEAELRVYWEGWQRLRDRMRQFDADILPQSGQRVAAALAAWQAGQGTLTTVLDARRMSLDNRMRRLQLLVEAAVYRVNLLYFAGE